MVVFLGECQGRPGFWVYGAAGDAGRPYDALDLTGKVALVFGAEGRGLRPLVRRACDELAAIPMQGPVEQPQRERGRGAVPLRGAPPARAPPRRRERRGVTPATTGEPRRMAGVHDSYIVDGYNVLHALFPGMRREQLEDSRAAGWPTSSPASRRCAAPRSTLVFDAHAQPRSTCEPLAGTRVEVCFAGGSQSADEMIARRIAGEPADAAIVVVSADYEVQRTATGPACAA